MFKIGLTGGIGSGKSTVAEIFAQLGVAVYDADIEARVLVEPGQPALQRIVAEFGSAMLTADGSLDRGKLRTITFSDDTKRKRLEAILHPLIRAALQRKAAAASEPYCVLVIPLLFEADQRDIVDRILVVDTDEDRQRARAMARTGMARDEVEKIMAVQWPRAQRLAHADDVLTNNGSVADLRGQIERLHQRYLELAHQADAAH